MIRRERGLPPHPTNRGGSQSGWRRGTSRCCFHGRADVELPRPASFLAPSAHAAATVSVWEDGSGRGLRRCCWWVSPVIFATRLRAGQADHASHTDGRPPPGRRAVQVDQLVVHARHRTTDQRPAGTEPDGSRRPPPPIRERNRESNPGPGTKPGTDRPPQRETGTKAESIVRLAGDREPGRAPRRRPGTQPGTPGLVGESPRDRKRPSRARKAFRFGRGRACGPRP